MARQQFILFFALVVVIGCLPIHCRREPYDICEFKCVQAVYNKYCGGTPCVFGSINEDQREALCTTRCLSAIEGKEMFKCLKGQDPLRDDFKEVQQTLGSQIYGTLFPGISMFRY